MRRLALLVGLAGLLLAGCGDDGASEASVQSATVGGGGKDLTLVVDSCQAEQSETTTEETDTEVQVTVEVTNPAGGDCAGTEVRVRLTQPLADRTLIDASTDDEIPVED